MIELFRIYLNNFCQTQKTIHSNQYGILPTPYALSIVKYLNDDGFYLFYLDELGNEQADTYHSSLKEAFEQAEFEFGVKEKDWIKRDEK